MFLGGRGEAGREILINGISYRWKIRRSSADQNWFNKVQMNNGGTIGKITLRDCSEASQLNGKIIAKEIKIKNNLIHFAITRAIKLMLYRHTTLWRNQCTGQFESMLIFFSFARQKQRWKIWLWYYVDRDLGFVCLANKVDASSRISGGILYFEMAVCVSSIKLKRASGWLDLCFREGPC